MPVLSAARLLLFWPDYLDAFAAKVNLRGGQADRKLGGGGMASKRQIKANRANAKRSTGPKTAIGKLRSSRNALRHGLSCPRQLDAVPSEIENFAQALMVDGGDDGQRLAATALASAQWELMRIRSVRARLMATIDLSSTDPQE